MYIILLENFENYMENEKYISENFNIYIFDIDITTYIYFLLY